MEIASHFDTLVSRIAGPDLQLAADEAHAIATLVYLAAEIDLDEDSVERRLVPELVERIEALGRASPRRPPLARIPLPIDVEGRSEVVHRLTRSLRWTPARELAYVLAYLVTISDLELAPVESLFVDELRRVFDIKPERAAELVARAATTLTPSFGAWAQ